MHTTYLIAKHLANKVTIPKEQSIQVCCVTGEKTLCVKRSLLFSKKFSDCSLLAVPSSEWVGLQPYIALSSKEERSSHWLVTEDEFKTLSKKDIRNVFTDGVDSKYWSCYVTTSFRKHGSLSAIVNKKSFGHILFEQTNIDCSNSTANKELLNNLIEFRINGIPRETLETGIIKDSIVAKVGIKTYKRFIDFFESTKRARTYSLACYILPTAEELGLESHSKATVRRKVKSNAPRVEASRELPLF